MVANTVRDVVDCLTWVCWLCWVCLPREEVAGDVSCPGCTGCVFRRAWLAAALMLALLLLDCLEASLVFWAFSMVLETLLRGYIYGEQKPWLGICLWAVFEQSDGDP